MTQPVTSIDEISRIFLTTTKKTLEASTGQKITFSPTIQNVPRISMKPDLTCFVQFDGDYSGLVILNFSAEAAFEIYRKYMLSMGMPAEELAGSIRDADVTDTIGEITNQLMGNLIRDIEEKFELNATFGQPKALTLNAAITLVIDADFAENRRLSFKINNYSFRIELAMEHTEFTFL